MKSLLPRHIRGIDWDGKKQGPREKSQYWDGRWALSHPNGYYDDERSVEMLLTLIRRAEDALVAIQTRAVKTGALAKAETTVVEEASADLINKAYQALDEIEHHFPLVECWVTYHTSDHGWLGHESPVSPFMGFFDLDTALIVAEMWQASYGKSAQWYVTRGGANINMVYDRKFTDMERLRPSR